MDPERYRQIKELFAEASELDAAARDTFLSRACAGDDLLRDEIDELLRADSDHKGDALDQAVERALSDTPSEPATSVGHDPAFAAFPAEIGRYRIVGVCGVGGMGTVYEAQQETPKRRVAVKVIQGGLLRPDLLKRFRREAEILGRLQHPGIAQIFEAGEFQQDGQARPYFAMEFIEGPSLIQYADQNDLSPGDREELIILVCEAVHHAHGQGVVHRDLKPDNILVVEPITTSTRVQSMGAQPKVLDFGVAHLVDADSALTLATGDRQLVGSLPYMSPEQASGGSSKVDARSDVYSLGVLLFELLAGRLPYALRDRALMDAVRVICDDEPIRLGSLDTRFRGDLETIASKCLEKDPGRRYATALELAEDLRRHVELRPISARPPSALYQLKKFARRNRALVTGTTIAVVALVIGLVASILFALRSSENEQRAIREAYRANLTAADALMETDPLAARRTLDTVPAKQRGWEWRYLDSRLSPGLLEFGSFFERSPLVVIDNGKALLAGRDAHKLSQWDLQTGTEIATWTAPAAVSSWGISPDGSKIAAGAADGRVWVAPRSTDSSWELWLDADARIIDLDFSPDSSRLSVLCHTFVKVGRPGAWVHSDLPEAPKDPFAAFSPLGDRIAICTRSQYVSRVSLRDAVDLTESQHHENLEGFVAMDFSPDGSEIAASTAMRAVRIHATDSLQRTASLVGHRSQALHVVYGPEGLCMSTGSDGFVRVWDRTRTCIAALSVPGALGSVFAGASRIVTATGARLRVFQLDHDRNDLRGDSEYMYEVAFSDDGELLATHAPFPPRELRIWSALDGQPVHEAEALSAAAKFGFDRDGTIQYEHEGMPWSHDWASGEPPQPHSLNQLTHRWDFETKQLEASGQATQWPDPTQLTVYRTRYDIGADGSEPVHLFADGKKLGPHGDSTTTPALGDHPRLFIGSSPTGERPMSGSIIDFIVVDGGANADDLRSIEGYLLSRRAGSSVDMPDIGKSLIAHFRADEDSVSTARHISPLLDSEPKQVVTSWAAENDPSVVLRPVGNPARAITYSDPADGEPAAVAFDNQSRWQRRLEVALPEVKGKDQLVVFWLGKHLGEWGSKKSTTYVIGTQASIASSTPPSPPPKRRLGTARSLSADGRLLALGSDRHPTTCRLRNAETGELLAEFSDTSGIGGYSGVSLHPREPLLACGHTSGRVDIFDTRTHEKVTEVDAHVGTVFAVDWSPDGSRMVTGGNDAMIRIWDSESFDLLLELRGHTQYVKAVAFSPDGTMLASAAGDGSARIWDSLPRSVRYQAKLESERIQDEVRERVESWWQELQTPAAVVAELRKAWSSDPKRLQAARRVLVSLIP